MDLTNLTDRELQEYLDYAQALLHLSAAFDGGFIEKPFPLIRDGARAQLAEGARRGLRPRPDALGWLIHQLANGPDDPWRKAVPH